MVPTSSKQSKINEMETTASANTWASWWRQHMSVDMREESEQKIWVEGDGTIVIRARNIAVYAIQKHIGTPDRTQ